MASRFSENVFLNCPFDAEYRPLLRALIFTVLDCGLRIRIASEQADSGQVRIAKIMNLIRSARLSIHDISRMEPLRSGDLPRFNMPFELGLDLGCKTYGGSRFAQKQCLILERERYRYQKVISDISGNDVRAHDGDPEKAVIAVRNWIKVVTRRRVPAASTIWQRFSDCLSYLATTLKQQGYSAQEIEELEAVEFIEYATDWIKRTPAV